MSFISANIQILDNICIKQRLFTGCSVDMSFLTLYNSVGGAGQAKPGLIHSEQQLLLSQDFEFVCVSCSLAFVKVRATD